MLALVPLRSLKRPVPSSVLASLPASTGSATLCAMSYGLASTAIRDETPHGPTHDDGPILNPPGSAPGMSAPGTGHLARSKAIKPTPNAAPAGYRGDPSGDKSMYRSQNHA